MGVATLCQTNKLLHGQECDDTTQHPHTHQHVGRVVMSVAVMVIVVMVIVVTVVVVILMVVVSHMIMG